MLTGNALSLLLKLSRDGAFLTTACRWFHAFWRATIEVYLFSILCVSPYYQDILVPPVTEGPSSGQCAEFHGTDQTMHCML